jgi:hypothetical protein
MCLYSDVETLQIFGKDSLQSNYNITDLPCHVNVCHMLMSIVHLPYTAIFVHIIYLSVHFLTIQQEEMIFSPDVLNSLEDVQLFLPEY